MQEFDAIRVQYEGNRKQTRTAEFNYVLGCDAVYSGRLSTSQRSKLILQAAVSACCLLGFLFYPEDGESTFFRNVDKLPSGYT
jgi:hypothetical protein